jgi:DNA-directed RNA polymerase subunit RPC12/RpoP
MATTKIEVLFGKIAVSCGFVNDEQLAAAVEAQEGAPDGTHLGKIMVDLGFLSDEELMTVLAIQRENRSRLEMSPAVRKMGMTLGRLAIEKEFCNEQQVHECIREQAKLERFNLFFRLGEVMVSKGVLPSEKVHELLQTQNITILGCPACFSKFNVLNYQDGMGIACPKCGHPELERPVTMPALKVDGSIDEGDSKKAENQKADKGKPSDPPDLPDSLKNMEPDFRPPSQS